MVSVFASVNRYDSRTQFVHSVVLSFFAFLVPFTMGHPQLLVGVLVNALIIRAALTLPASRALPVVFAPSFGVLARGVLFGPFTLYVAYMMPFIWAGNMVLFYAFNRMKTGYFKALAVSSLAKTLVILTPAYLLYSVGMLPQVLLAGFGVIQLVTALVGGILAYASFRR